jgi:protein TonB
MNAIYTLNNEVSISEVVSKVLRLSTSVSFGVLATGILFLLMCSLIAMDPPVRIENKHKVIEVVMSDDRVIEALPEQIEPKPIDPEPQPPMPKIAQNFELEKGTEVFIEVILDPGVREIDNGLSSGSAMAIFKVAPRYPRRALTKGIEGFVDLMFDITPSGKTENIRVIYAEPKGYFESSSIKTLAKWKYKPAMDEGVAMPQKNQKTRLIYELEK